MVNRKQVNDFDKIFITFSLWTAMISLFATALTLPMLPDQVYIFYKTTDMDAESYSKYNNLLTVLSSFIPALIVLVAASLRKRNKMQHNFMSIMLFCIALSICMAGVNIYGLCMQLAASSSVRYADNNAIIAMCIGLFLSMLFAVLPTVFHSPKYVAGAESRPLNVTYVMETFDRFWNVGAYGFLIMSIIASFLINGYSYIPIAVGIVAYGVFMIVMCVRRIKKGGADVKIQFDNDANADVQSDANAEAE